MEWGTAEMHNSNGHDLLECSSLQDARRAQLFRSQLHYVRHNFLHSKQQVAHQRLRHEAPGGLLGSTQTGTNTPRLNHFAARIYA